MSRIQRVKSFAIGLVMLLVIPFLLYAGENGSSWVVVLLACNLILMGLRSLVYYFQMARFMVGGLTTLLIGIFLIDFGMVSLSLADEGQLYTLLYLAGWSAFSGLISLMRAWESKKNQGKSWKLNVLYGLGNIAIAAACFYYYDAPEMLTLLYCIGLGYSGVLRIMNAFRTTAIVYIQ